MSHMGELRIELDEYEAGELSFDEELELFAKLIKSGMAWTLTSRVAREADGLIMNGLVSENGEVLCNLDEL